MLRNIIHAVILLALMYACNNDLSTIGQEVIDNDNYIGEETYYVENVATVRADSFVTSSGLNTAGYIDKLIVGRYHDEYSGTTVAVPCFQVTPQQVPSLPDGAILDSLTLEFGYGGTTWGDTLYDVKKQTYFLYQLRELPGFDYENYGYFYDNTEVCTGELLGRSTFYPLAVNINKAYFKIDQDVAEDLFDRAKYRRDKEDDIYDPEASAYFSFYKFLDYFKGLAIVPAPENDCLISLQADSDSLFFNFFYSVSGGQYNMRFPLSAREYQYNHFTNDPMPAYAGLTDRYRSVSLEESEVAFTQGLCRYMAKMTLPEAPQFGKYRTILKAQLEIKPEYMYHPKISLPKTITVYATDDRNEMRGKLMNNSKAPVTGILMEDPLDPEKTRYIFDMTEYYQRLSSQTHTGEKQQILLSVPGDGFSGPGISFDQMAFKEVPLLKVYYAKYK